MAKGRIEAEMGKEEMNKILVTDDNPVFVNSVRNVFENTFYRVATTDSITDALEKVRRENLTLLFSAL